MSMKNLRKIDFIFFIKLRYINETNQHDRNLSILLHYKGSGDLTLFFFIQLIFKTRNIPVLAIYVAYSKCIN